MGSQSIDRNHCQGRFELRGIVWIDRTARPSDSWRWCPECAHKQAIWSSEAEPQCFVCWSKGLARRKKQQEIVSSGPTAGTCGENSCGP